MKFYIDLDGVLVDLRLGYYLETGYELNDVWSNWNKNKSKIWNAVKNKTFWLNLPKTKECNTILSLLEPVKDMVYILSSPIKKDRDECKKQKIQWVLNNTWIPEKRIHIVNRQDKSKFSRSSSILVDDYKDNIIQWEDKGGCGILHQNIDETTLKIKKKILEEEESNAKKY